MGQIRILKVLIEETRFRKVVLDISRFISHTLRLSWAAAFAQHTFCLTHTRAAGKQKNCQKEDKNKIHKYRRNYLSKQGSILNTFLLGTKEWPGKRNPNKYMPNIKCQRQRTKRLSVSEWKFRIWRKCIWGIIMGKYFSTGTVIGVCLCWCILVYLYLLIMVFVFVCKWVWSVAGGGPWQRWRAETL